MQQFCEFINSKGDGAAQTAVQDKFEKLLERNQTLPIMQAIKVKEQ